MRELIPYDTPCELTRVGNYSMYLRPATTDDQICKAIIEKREYHRWLDPPRSTDVWLDVGANIGAFTLMVADDVHRVYAYEPDPYNCTILNSNLQLNGVDNVHVEQLAIDARGPWTELYLNGHRSKASHSTLPRRGRERIVVQAQTIQDAQRISGANKVKIDAEGIEYYILSEIDLDPIDEIICEWHFNILGFLGEDDGKYRRILDRLTHAGFTRSRYRLEDLGRNWHTVIWFAR
jgi:FkbM family methyltransferase